MTYINYCEDRRSLGFECKADLNSTKQLINAKNKLLIPLKNTKEYVLLYIQKGKDRFYLRLPIKFVVFIYALFGLNEPNFSNSMNVNEYFTNSNSLNITSQVSTSTSSSLTVQGGHIDNPEDELDSKLIDSVQSAALENPSTSSFNKSAKKILKFIDPLISNQNFWRLVSEGNRPVTDSMDSSTSQFHSSSEILGSQKTSIFVESWTSSLPTHKKSRKSLESGPIFEQIKKSNNQPESNECSERHKDLSAEDQLREKRTQTRRSMPKRKSAVLKEGQLYAEQQLVRKGREHLESMGISTKGLTDKQVANILFDIVESSISSSKVQSQKTEYNGQEIVDAYGNPETRQISTFENNPNHPQSHFISSYIVSQRKYDKWKETGKLGLTPKERADLARQIKLKKDKIAQKKAAARKFFREMNPDLKVSNDQIRKANNLKKQIRENPDRKLTPKEQKLLNRVKKFNEHKNKFFPNNDNL